MAQHTKGSPFDNYSVKRNTIDLTTQPISAEHQGCLVDRKLVDLLTKHVINIPFEDAKAAILEHMAQAQCFADMQQFFDESIYVHTICTLIAEKDAEIEERQSTSLSA